jgi:hypothetical protein
VDEVVPDAGGHVGGDVGVEGGLLDPAGPVVLVPRAVRALCPDQPGVRGLRLGAPTARVEGHGRLHVVPRVAVAAGIPRDHPVTLLDGRDRVDRRRQITPHGLVA